MKLNETQTDQLLVDVAKYLQRISEELEHIAGRLESWDRMYKTNDGRELHELRMVANVYSQGR